MFKKLEKVTKRRNTTPVKVLYRIEVNNITIKNATNIEGKVYVSCCFERGNKIVTTNDELCRVEMNGNAEVYFDQTLSLVATMYQDPDGKYLEKFGKFIFRFKTKSGNYKGLGVYDLPLHYYATRYQPVDEIISLTKISASSIMAHITITPKILDQTADDSASNYSGCTDHTTGAADFSCQMSDTGSEIGDGEDDDMMDRSSDRTRSLSIGIESGSPERNETLTKAKSVPMMTSPSSIPKRTSPVPHNGPPVSGNYSNLNSLPPILSSDSIDDEIVSPLEPSHTEISVIKESDESHCVHHESDEDEALNVRESETGEEHNLGTKKLLSQQESSEPINMRQSSKKKSTGFLCCFSPGSTTDAVIRQDVPSDTQRSNTRSSQQDTSKTVKKSQKHQEVNASRGKSHGESKSLDTSVGKSSSSHGKKQPGSAKKTKSSSNSQNDLSSNPQHGTTKKRNPEGESKPAWLN